MADERAGSAARGQTIVENRLDECGGLLGEARHAVAAVGGALHAAIVIGKAAVRGDTPPALHRGFGAAVGFVQPPV